MLTQMTLSPAKVLVVPGLHGSAPEHWQSLWEKQHPEFRRVEQVDCSSAVRVI
jgi:predicted alpha/beta hydrolase family esterase